MIYDLLIIDAKECLVAVDIIELIELTLTLSLNKACAMRHQVLRRYVMIFIKMAVKVEYRLSKIQYLAELQYT